MKIAIVASRFNSSITQALVDGAKAELISLGILTHNIALTWVPGAVELAIIAKQYALLHYDAIICFGAVIRGETDHYDHVANQASYGCQRVALDHNIPVVFGVLTTHNLLQARARVGGGHGHYGKECARTAVEMVETVHSIGVFSVATESNV